MLFLLLAANFALADSVSEVEARAMGGERLVRLVRYRAKVEKLAYAETLNLCAYYPLARRNLLGDRDPQPAWVGILGHGLVQPISLFGLKNDYNRVNRVRLWQFDAWFRSVHTIYLVKSDGFRRAASRCLGTSDPNEIARFAYAVTTLDILGTLIAGEFLTYPIGRGLTWSLERTKPLWSRVIPPGLSKRFRHFGFVSLLPLGAIRLTEYLRDLREARAAAQYMIENTTLEHENMNEASRRILMARAELELRAAADQNDPSKFEVWARRNISFEARRLAHEDYRALIVRADVSEDQRRYLIVLKSILPILDQMSAKAAIPAGT